MSAPSPEFRHDIAAAVLALPVAAAFGFTFTTLRRRASRNPAAMAT